MSVNFRFAERMELYIYIYVFPKIELGVETRDGRGNRYTIIIDLPDLGK